jgi:hypothetical protein
MFEDTPSPQTHTYQKAPLSPGGAFALDASNPLAEHRKARAQFSVKSKARQR